MTSWWTVSAGSLGVAGRLRIGTRLLLLLLLLRPALAVEADEVDRVDQHRRKAALARDVGHGAARKGEDHRRDVDEQHRLEPILRDHGAEGHQGAIIQLDHEGGALLVLGRRPDLQEYLEEPVLLFLLQRPRIDMHLDLELWRLPDVRQDARRMWTLEGEILDVLAMNDNRRFLLVTLRLRTAWLSTALGLSPL